MAPIQRRRNSDFLKSSNSQCKAPFYKYLRCWQYFQNRLTNNILIIYSSPCMTSRANSINLNSSMNKLSIHSMEVPSTNNLIFISWCMKSKTR
ncbi:hypothetical protein AQUCO_01200100v1 [Aquilegia coerulea]|uniref:Uncharacterized protein n=1 Tax=Aquilegia coerulea TaxID=218851 RepID=A0A2G5E4J0_AQUCA|nr:hypothetical protein AQUCO_01200100v1 [Aquilegia coerulea]